MNSGNLFELIFGQSNKLNFFFFILSEFIEITKFMYIYDHMHAQVHLSIVVFD